MKFFLLLVIVAAFLANCLALKNDICGQPHSRNGDGVAVCLAYMPRWTYDAAANECIKFIYGGCGGNKNQFPDQEKCEAACLE
ncbi:male accessory gland serine protease inhibitor-like [Drosophila novamexicana]|uniref:BPTI/Kunitz inhibitor domain-containing protein n=1 Tax=Drosophila virilis TaxID=7244 RepID=A0A0Q9WAS3_DROVI|nr:male accessory gland serine protease inhibitor [Drosophila virilis]XP_030557056.1 male accessory gland serine protease inhibitor-like [Drosophila novamexicana]KRF81788.1 uncharacterized protein Dvir_GJ26680 [Drosophila virilis]